MTAPRRGAALLGAVLLLSGCGFRGAYSFDLPGGADVGDRPYTVQIQFADVLDLVPQSGVRVADVPVGRVEDISLSDDWTAVVTVEVDGDVDRPANATAAIVQSSLLGEKYVELAAPGSEPATGALQDGALITLDRTNRNVEVEELLGALSLVLNGGGIAQLQTINAELGQAMEGREGAIRDTLSQLDTFIVGLDQQKTEINRALDSVNALATTLSAGTGTITTALDTIGPGLDVVTQQRELLVGMLQSLSRLGDVGTRVINQAGADTVADLQLLQPVLSQLAAAGPDLAESLDLLLSYPFPASSLSTLHTRQDVRTGGYALFTNMTATLDLDLSRLLCRYVVDPATGALRIVDLADTAAQACAAASRGGGSPDGAATEVEDAPAPDAVDEVAGEPVEQTRRSRRAVLPLVPVLAVLLLLLLAGCAVLWLTRPADSAVRTDAYVGALQAARAGIVDVASFDYVTLDDDIEQIRTVTTGDLRVESVDQLDQRRQQITAAQAVVDTTVVGAAVGDADEDSATVFAVIQSTQQTNASQQAQVQRYRVEISLQRVDGRWLLSGITGR